MGAKRTTGALATASEMTYTPTMSTRPPQRVQECSRFHRLRLCLLLGRVSLTASHHTHLNAGLSPPVGSFGTFRAVPHPCVRGWRFVVC